MLKILEMIGFASEMMLRIAGIIFCAVLLGIIVWFIVSLGHDDAAVAERPERVSITLDDHSAPVAAENVEQTIRELFQACPGARDNWVDVTSATIKLNSEEDVLDRRDYWPVDTYGWTNYYELTMKISDDPVSVHYRAASHTLHYMIGWGGTPGLTMPKDAGMHFCGLPFDPSPNSYFVPWNFTPVQEPPTSSYGPNDIFRLSARSSAVAPEDVDQAIKEFFLACPGASDHWGDVTSAGIEFYGAEELRLWIRIVDDPIFMPPDVARHRLWYTIRWGDTPGLATSRSGGGMSFCKFPPDETDRDHHLWEDYFYPWDFTPVQEAALKRS